MRENYFLAGVAQRIIELQQEHKLAIVLPNRRAGLYLKHRFLPELIDTPTFVPDIFTMDEFLTNIAGVRAPEKMQQILLLYSAYETSVPEPVSFGQFIRSGLQYLSDFSDLDNALVDVDTFFSLIAQDREMIRDWTPDSNDADELLQQAYFDFWLNAREIYRKLNKKLDALGGGYAGYNHRQAIQRLELGYEMDYTYILFAGFNVLTQAEEAVINHFYNQNQAEVIWDMDPLYAGENANLYKAGVFYRKYQQKWMTAPLSDQIHNHELKVISVESPSFTAQCAICTDILTQLIKSYSITDLSTIAIVLCDETLLEPLLLSLPAAPGTYNVTMGKALNTFGVYHFFEKILQLFSHYSNESFDTQAILSLGASPEMEKLDQFHLFQNISGIINKFNIVKWTKNKTKHYVNNGIWARILNTDNTPSTLFALIQDIIQLLRPGAGDQTDRAYIEVLFEFSKLFNQLESLYTEYPEILDIYSIQLLFREVAAQSKLPFEGEPIKGIQVMGLLETRALDFEHVILLSANEGILPPGKSTTTQIPHIFRKYFNLPTFEERDSIFAYSFYRLLHHAKTLHAVYNGTGDEFGAKERSRYLMQLEAICQLDQHDQLSYQEEVYSIPLNNTPEFVYKIEKKPEIIAEILDFLQKKKLSASSINKLIASPLEFYLSYVLGIREQEELELDLETNTIGEVIHYALEQLYKPFEGEQLTPKIFSEINEKKKAALDDAFKAKFYEGDVSNGYNYLMYQTAEKMLHEAIELDMERAKELPLTILHNEVEMNASFPLEYNGEVINVNLYGRIDRVQKVGNMTEIIDFKSGGKTIIKHTNVEDIGVKYDKDKLMQLVIYAYLYAHDPSVNGDLNNLALALCFLKSSNDKLEYFSKSDIVLNEENLQIVIGNVKSALLNLLDINQPFVPEDYTRIKYSPFLDVWQIEKKVE
jgi:hypothetical protein